MVVPEEDHRHAEAGSLAGKAGDARPKSLATAAGQRQEHAGAVPGAPVGRGRSAVANIVQSFEQRVDDLSRGAAGRVGDEADPACVAFLGWAELRLHERTSSGVGTPPLWC